MLDDVREAFQQEKRYQEEKGITCQSRLMDIQILCLLIGLVMFSIREH